MSEDQELKTAIVQDINAKITDPATANAAGVGILLVILPEMPLDILQAMQVSVNKVIELQAQTAKGGA